MTAPHTVPRAVVLTPRLGRAPFAAVLAGWLTEGAAAPPERGAGAVLAVVPEYLRTAPRPVLDDLAARDWTGAVVGIVGYGGRGRARYAVAEAREVLGRTGAVVVPPALGVDVAQVRAHGFDEADRLLRDALLDTLADAAGLRSG